MDEPILLEKLASQEKSAEFYDGEPREPQVKANK
jgi:hypothetical protein